MNRRERRMQAMSANELENEEHAMKVTMATVMCGPEGNAFQGTVLDIPKDAMQAVKDPVTGKVDQVPLGDYLIENKFARAYDPVKDAKARQRGLVKAER